MLKIPWKVFSAIYQCQSKLTEMIIPFDRVTLVRSKIISIYSQVSVSWQIQNVPIAVRPVSKKLSQHRVRNRHGRKHRGITSPTVTTVVTSMGFSPSMCLAAADHNSSSKAGNSLSRHDTSFSAGSTRLNLFPVLRWQQSGIVGT